MTAPARSPLEANSLSEVSLCDICIRFLKAPLIPITCDGITEISGRYGPTRYWLVGTDVTTATEENYNEISAKTGHGARFEESHLSKMVPEIMSFIVGTGILGEIEDNHKKLLSFSINETAPEPFRHNSDLDREANKDESLPACPLCDASFRSTVLIPFNVGDQAKSDKMSDMHKESFASFRPVCIIQTSSPSALKHLTTSDSEQIYGKEHSISGTFAVLEKNETTYRLVTANLFRLGYIPVYQRSFRGIIGNREENVSQQERPKLITSSKIRSDERKTRALRKIRRWIEDGCGHNSCQSNSIDERIDPDRQALPSRLLRLDNIGGNVTVRLVDTCGTLSQDPNLKYATLSHRWSSSVESVKLLATNYSRYSSGIPVRDLPVTFQDAIEVALALDVQHLWIDALCIIQDSADDWSHEAPRMFMIYSRGTFNIAATGSVDSNESLFIQNDIPASRTIQMTWDIPGLPKGEWVVLAHDGEDEEGYRSFVTGGPLNRRGWVLQERALARRSINFARDQIWWECQQEIHNESNVSASKSDYQPQIGDGDWWGLVREYSDTDLSFPSDRLVAFAGVAEAFATHSHYRPEDYIAGMWKQRLPEDLFWFCAYDPPNRSGAYIAPTWSWASVRARVVIRRPHIPEDGTVFHNKSFSILQISTVLASRSPFGQVSGGFMKCVGLIHPITYRYSEAFDKFTLDVCDIAYTEDIQVSKSTTTAMLENHDGRFRTFRANLSDCSNFDVTEHLSAFVVPIMCKKTPRVVWNNPFGRAVDACNVLYNLLIQKVDERGCFKRIGVLLLASYGDSISLPSWWDQNSDFPDDPHFIRRTDGVYEFTII